MNRLRVLTAVVLNIAMVATISVLGSEKTNGGRDLIKQEEIKEWLTYLASDELEGRAAFTEGKGIAAAYIAQHLKSWGVKPGGGNGSYFQRVEVRGIRSENASTVTIQVDGESRTFKNGEGVVFPSNVGANREVTSSEIEFVGYGLSAPDAGHDDYAGLDVSGKVVVWMGLSGPAGLSREYRRLLGGRARFATEMKGAAAGIAGFQVPARQRSNQPQAIDFTSVQRLDRPVPPSIAARDEFFEFLFTGAEMPYAELKEKADKGEPLPRFSLKNVTVTFNIDANYRVMRTQYTRNVVGIIEGADPSLKDTYVLLGAHYDHVGYADGEIVITESGARMGGARGRVTAGAEEHRIWNGADDNGSGSVAIMAIARAFALGPKPRRSVIFVWYAAEEIGLLGSRYFADHPTVPIDRIEANINMDMVGRSKDNLDQYSNTVFVVGADRISTDLHNITIDANEALDKPLTLDFAMNDPADPEQIYFRSDHYSFAAKGIPALFLFTGIHPDYHANTDTVDKVSFDKIERIAKLAYEVTALVGNRERPLTRDNKGPRAGVGSKGKLN